MKPNLIHNRTELAILSKIFTRFQNMKSLRTALITGMMLLVLSACQQDTNGQSRESKESSVLKKDTVQPKVDIKVNRHYDEQGNLIGFDSTYSSYYSNVQDDTTGIGVMMRNFQSSSSRSLGPSILNPFKDFYFSDTVFYKRFFEDPFYKRPFFQDESFYTMMDRLDSLRDHHLQNIDIGNNEASKAKVQ